MHTYDQRFFDIGSATGSGGKADGGGNLRTIFFFQKLKSIFKIMYQLFGGSDTNMYRRIYRCCAPFTLGSRKNNRTGATHQNFTTRNGCITLCQLFVKMKFGKTLMNDIFQM